MLSAMVPPHVDASSHHDPQAQSVFVLHERCETLEHHHESSHTEHGLTFVVAGKLRLEHGSTMDISPGTVTIMPAGMPHRPLAGHDLEYWLVGMCASCLGLDETQPLMRCFHRVRRGALPVVAIAQARQALLTTCFRELQAECARATPESPALIASWLRLILAEVSRAMPSGQHVQGLDSLVTCALEYIQRHCLDSISLEDVARAVHRTPAHVAQTVKKATGYSVGAWINSGRIAEATTRLLHTDDSLDSIAQHVGWKDVTHFIRQFRKSHGKTPAAWRRDHRQAHMKSRDV